MHEPKDDFCTVYVRIPVVQVPHHHTTWSSSLLHTVPVQVKTVHDSAPFWTDSVPGIGKLAALRTTSTVKLP